MKIYRLSMIICLSLYSCTSSPVQNISPSTSPSKAEQTTIVTNQPESTSSPNIQLTPSAEIIPSSSPSIALTDINNVSSVTIIADDNTLIRQKNFKTGYYISNIANYNILPNEKKKFDAYFIEGSEIKKSDIGWSSSNTDIATVDDNGLVSATNKSSNQDLIGSTTIKVYIKSNPEISISFAIKLYKKLEIISKDPISCKEISRKNLPRYQPVENPSPGGSTSDIMERTTFYGKVYDKDKNLLDGVTVTAKKVCEIEESNNENSKVYTQITTAEGIYIFRGLIVGDGILITASKEGYITKSRKGVAKSNLNGDPNANTFNFGGDNPDDSIFALEKIEN